jgi:hypothetical protein
MDQVIWFEDSEILFISISKHTIQYNNAYFRTFLLGFIDCDCWTFRIPSLYMGSSRYYSQTEGYFFWPGSLQFFHEHAHPELQDDKSKRLHSISSRIILPYKCITYVSWKVVLNKLKSYQDYTRSLKMLAVIQWNVTTMAYVA